MVNIVGDGVNGVNEHTKSIDGFSFGGLHKLTSIKSI